MDEKTNENEKNEVLENVKEETKKEEKVEKEIKTEEKQENSDEKIDEKQEANKEDKKEVERKSWAREAIEWIVCIVIAIALAVVIKYFLFTPTLVMQDSMTPTILNGERVFINRLVRTFDWELKRGDIITFEAPSGIELGEGDVTAEYQEVEGVIDSIIYYGLEHGKTSYIKRVIGLPGEHVEIKDGHVYIDGELLEEDYLDDSVATYVPDIGIDDFFVPEGYIFAMGDNRENSTDCRLFGCVPLDKVEGRVTIRIWPLNKFGEIDK